MNFCHTRKVAVVQSRDLQDCAGPVARAHPDLPILRRSLEALRVVWLRAVCEEVGADSSARLPHPRVHCGGIVTSHLHSVTVVKDGDTCEEEVVAENNIERPIRQLE